MNPQAGANGVGAWNESAGEQLRILISMEYLYTWLKSIGNEDKYSYMEHYVILYG